MIRATTNPHRRRARLAVLAAASLCLVFFAGSVAAPLLQSEGRPLGSWMRLAYAPVCHQMAERSLVVGGVTQAVCARCSGLYLGGVLGLAAGAVWFVGVRRRPRPAWLALAVAPTALDFLLPWIGLTGLANLPRLLLAIPAGAIAALFLAVGIADVVSSVRPRPRDAYVSHAIPALEEPDG